MKNFITHKRIDFQSKFNDIVNELYNDIYKFQNSKLAEIKSPKTEEFLNKIKSHISDGLYEIKSQMEHLLNDLEWKEYNIAFFGETNSGKSTVIEALVSGNGKSIGDGRKDYTQKVSAVGYDSVNLMDMPGIEGNESKYQNEIEKAVNKSHVIFYIIGTNKEPEEITINKIKNYLRATAKVYSILNIRGKASVFKYKKELIGDNENKIIDRTNSKFSLLFNNHYSGNIALNGHISFLCGYNSNNKNSLINRFVSLINNIGNFIYKKIFRRNTDVKLGRKFSFSKEKEDLINIFGNIETAYEYSNIIKLKELLNTLSVNSASEILTANSYKLTTILESLKQKLINENNDFNQVIQSIKIESQKTLTNVEYLFDKYEEEYISSSNLQFTKLETQLLKKAYEGIDNEWEKETIEQELQIIGDNFKKDVENIFNNIKYQFEKEFKKLTQELNNRLLLNLSNSFDYNSSIKDLLKDLPTGFMQDLIFIGEYGLSLGGIIMAFEVHWIVGVIAVIFAIILNVINFFKSEEKKIQKKKDKAREKIKENISEKKEEVMRKINKSFKENKNKFITFLNKSINDLGNDSDVLDKKISEFLKLISNYSDKINNINKY